MEQTPLPPLVSNRLIRGECEDDKVTPYEVRDQYEADRQRTREVVQALVDALSLANTKLPARSALPTGTFTYMGYVCASVDAAFAVAKSRLQIEPTK